MRMIAVCGCDMRFGCVHVKRDFGLGFPQEPARENPYQSQESIDTYNWMLRSLVAAKLETFLGPYYKPTSARPTRNENIRSQIRPFRPRPYTFTRRYNCSRR